MVVCANSRTYSSKAIEWINSISINEGIKIHHAENGGEFLISTTNKTASALYLEAMNREKFIRSLGFKLITIWESDYNEH